MLYRVKTIKKSTSPTLKPASFASTKHSFTASTVWPLLVSRATSSYTLYKQSMQTGVINSTEHCAYVQHGLYWSTPPHPHTQCEAKHADRANHQTQALSSHPAWRLLIQHRWRREPHPHTQSEITTRARRSN